MLMKRGEFIANWRKDLAIPLRDAAEQAGLAEETLVAIEGGSYEPSIDQLESISRTLGLRAEQLYADTIKPAAAPDALRVLFKSAELLQPPASARLAMVDAARSAL